MLKIFKNAFGIIAGMSSIIALAILPFKSIPALIVVLFFYCLSITFLVFAIYKAVCKSLATTHKNKFIRIASFCTFTSDDEKTARFETMRLIQSKVPFLDNIDHKFKWNGSGTPQIYVNGKDVSSSFIPNGNPGEFDSINIKFDKVISYNESASFKVALESQYSECIPRIRCKIDEPTKILQFRVLLGFKKGKQKPARIYRRLINSEVDTDIEECGVVDFDYNHKAYFHMIENPKIGYFYTMEWEK